jgi:uncharacterized protein (DUF2267 family)
MQGPAAHRTDQVYDDTWRMERFVATVQQQTGASRDEAERAARATLQTLAERISSARAQDLARALPAPVRPSLENAESQVERRNVEDFHVEELIGRVARREGVDAETASRHARATFVALARIVPGYELDELVAELPHEYEPFLGDVAARLRQAGPAQPLPADELVARVERRAGLDRDRARRVVEAVLETLAERIAGGEVDDVAAALPAEVRPALERGKARTGGNARRMSLDEFVARVAVREGASYEDALEHARAVFQTLREALPPKEVSDILDQLPRGYREALLA